MLVSPSGRATSTASRIIHTALVGVVLVVALWARVSATDYGLPYVAYNPDEFAVADGAMAMLNSGNLDVRAQQGPSLAVYVQAAVGELVLRYKSRDAKIVTARDIMLTGDNSKAGGPAGIPEYFHWGRILVAVMSSLTVLLVYFATRAVYGSQSGLIASSLLALAPLHERESRWLTTSVPVTFFIVASVLALVLALRRRCAALLLVGQALAGLAIYTKSNGRLSLVPVAIVSVVYVISTVKGNRQRLLGTFVVALGIILLAYLGAPFSGGGVEAIGAIPDYLIKPIWENDYVYGGVHTGADGPSGWDRTVAMLGADTWRYVALLSVVGAGWLMLITRFRAWTLLIMAIPIANFIVFSFFTVRFDRWLIPMLPFMAILSGASLWHFASWFARQFRLPAYWTPIISTVAVGLLLQGPLGEIQQRHQFLSLGDSRTQAAEWILENVPSGAKFVIEAYGPYVSPRDYDVVRVDNLGSGEIDWLRREGFDYAVASSWMYNRFVANPEKYQPQADYYATLFRDFPVVKEFDRGGPIIRLLRLANPPTEGMPIGNVSN